MIIIWKRYQGTRQPPLINIRYLYTYSAYNYNQLQWFLKIFPGWFKYLCQKCTNVMASYELVSSPGYYFLYLSHYIISTVYKQPWLYKILKLLRSGGSGNKKWLLSSFHKPRLLKIMNKFAHLHFGYRALL